MKILNYLLKATFWFFCVFFAFGGIIMFSISPPEIGAGIFFIITSLIFIFPALKIKIKEKSEQKTQSNLTNSSNRVKLKISRKEKKAQIEDLKNFVEESIWRDKGLNPEMIKVISEKALNINFEKLDNISKVKVLLDGEIVRWELNNGIIPSANPSVYLNLNEICFYKAQTKLSEKKEVTTSFSYGGPTARVKIANGISYRVGSVSVSRKKDVKEISIGKGSLHLTNKRLIFSGEIKSISINLNTILEFNLLDAESVIIKRSKGNPYIFEINSAERFYYILKYAIQGNSSSL